MDDKFESPTRSNQDISTILKSLVSDCCGKRSIAGQIREAFAEIENAQGKGFSLRVIAEELNNHGLDISVSYLKNVIKRVRAERKINRSHGPPRSQANAQHLIKVSKVDEPGEFNRNTDRDQNELF